MNFLIRRLTQPSALSFKPRLFFSISKQQMTEMHEAILASRIIQMIKCQTIKEIKNQKSQQLGQSQNQTVFFQSLRSQLISMIKQYSPTNEKNDTMKNKDFDGQSIQLAKNNMLRFFDGGVWVGEDLCIQQRFIPESDQLQKKQKSPNEKQGKVGQKSPQSQKNKIEEKKKLTFCPTYLITGQIFRIITSQTRYLLITGHFGIGKTYSFMLYHLLSDKIYRYLHRYCNQGQKIPSQIDDRFPKLVYLSINIKQFNQGGWSLINDIIAKQCYELTSEHPNYDFLNINHKKKSLKRFYQQKNIALRLVIDQIHVIASAARNHKNLIQFQKSLQKQPKFQKAQQEIKNDPSKEYLLDKLKNQNNETLYKNFENAEQIMKTYHSANQLLKIVHTLMTKFGRALYLSSRTIQESQMKYLNLNGQHTHTIIRSQSLDFMEFSQTKESLSDLAEFFVFMVELRYKNFLETKNITQKQKDLLLKIKKIFLNRLQQKNLMLLPYTMYLVFFQHSANKKNDIQGIKFSNLVKDILNQRNSYQQLQEFINQIIDKINNKSKAELRTLVDSFLKKSQSKDFQQVAKKKKILLLQLLYAIKQKKVKRYFDPKIRKREITVDASQILNNTHVFSSQISQNMSKNIAYYMDDKKFHLTVSEQIALQILQSYEISLLQALQESDTKIYSLFRTHASKGLFHEFIMTKLFSTIGAKITLKMLKQNSKVDYKKFTSIQGFQQLYFQSIPFKNSKNYHNFKFLIDIVQRSIKLDVGNHLFMPTRQELDVNNLSTGIHEQQKVDEKSKLIDFIVAQNTGSYITVRAFDVTSNQAQILNKIIRYFYELSNFQNKQQETVLIGNFKKSVQLNYVVMIPQALPDNIQWKVLIDKSISLLQEEKQPLDKMVKDPKNKNRNLKHQLQKIERLEKRIGFLENLLKDGNLITSQSTLQINRDKVKTLLTEVAVISYFDLQINDQDCLQKRDISLFKRLLKKAKLEHQAQKLNQIRKINRYP